MTAAARSIMSPEGTAVSLIVVESLLRRVLPASRPHTAVGAFGNARPSYHLLLQDRRSHHP
jgi:hypothetical protein